MSLQEPGAIKEHRTKLIAIIVYSSLFYSLPELACHTVGSRLVEQVIVLASPDFQKHLYEQFIKGCAITWVVDETANYVMQRLLEKCHSGEMVSVIPLKVDCTDKVLDNRCSILQLNTQIIPHRG